MKRGRPNEYTEEIPVLANKYLDECVDEEYEYHTVRGEKSDTYLEKVKVKLPTIAGMALYIGVSKNTLYVWAKENPFLQDALNRCNQMQEARLVEGTLSGRYNPTIAKLILSANQGYKERTDATTNDKDLPTPIVDLTQLTKPGIATAQSTSQEPEEDTD